MNICTFSLLLQIFEIFVSSVIVFLGFSSRPTKLFDVVNQPIQWTIQVKTPLTMYYKEHVSQLKKCFKRQLKNRL